MYQYHTFSGMLPLEEVIIAYLKLAVDYDNSAHNTKYCVQNMLRELQESVTGRRFLDSQTMEQLWYLLISLNSELSFLINVC